MNSISINTNWRQLIFVGYGLVFEVIVSPIGQFQKLSISGNYWKKFAKKANFFHEKACGIKNYSYLCISIEGEGYAEDNTS